MKQWNKSDIMQILAVFGDVNTLTVEACSETGPFRNLSTNPLRSQ